MCLDSVSSECIRENVNTHSRHLLKPVCILVEQTGSNRSHVQTSNLTGHIDLNTIKLLSIELVNGPTVVLKSSSPRGSRQIAQGIFKQSCRNPSYQNRFRFYLGLWYLSSLLEHDSNYSHQGACLEPSAKSVETASPQLVRGGLLTSPLRFF